MSASDNDKDKRRPSDRGLQIFWAAAVTVVFLGPLAVWLYRLALGL